MEYRLYDLGNYLHVYYYEGVATGSNDWWDLTSVNDHSTFLVTSGRIHDVELCQVLVTEFMGKMEGDKM